MATVFPNFVDLPEGEEPQPGIHVPADAAYLNSVNGAINLVENALPTKANSDDLATVATSGAYTDLIGPPFIPDSPDDIGAQPAGDYATNTALTTGLAGKADAVHTHAAADVTSGTLDIARIPTGTTTTTVALGDHTHGVADLEATGTADATTYLRGDGTWSVPASGGATADPIVLTPTGVVADDTAAMDAAVTLALSSGRPIHMKAGTYRRSTAWDCRGDNLTITTDGVLAVKVEQQASNVPILLIGHRWQRIAGMSLYYVSAQPNTNTAANAVEIYKSYLSFYGQFEIWGAARGLYIPQVDYVIEEDTLGNFAFSCRFSDIWVMRYSYAALDLQAFNTNATGCLFDNIYTNNDVGDGTTYSANTAVELKNWDEINIRQLNIEGVTLTTDTVMLMNEVRCGNIANLHYERVTLTAWGSAFFNLYGDGSRMMIDGLTVTRCPFANLAGGQNDLLGIVKVGNGTQLWVNTFTQHNNSPLTAPERVLVLTNWNEFGGSVEIVGSDHASLVTAVEKQVGDTAVSPIPVLKRINQDWLYYEDGGMAVTFGTAAPTTGTWAVGDKRWNTAPTAGGTPGWVCTTAGTPGTWSAMASLV